ncbi:hypothetical protein ADUPG1_008103 [Aduncisulcus paluster]|uniref:Transposase n=1 Tax=Aduncisulcus paluster TaxID=2918883 RepID=A0ABQ5KS42_9EUKA|nr:hypothetical protein ADUPG1_008103 [Aduncisulcus paluster]
MARRFITELSQEIHDVSGEISGLSEESGFEEETGDDQFGERTSLGLVVVDQDSLNRYKADLAITQSLIPPENPLNSLQEYARYCRINCLPCRIFLSLIVFVNGVATALGGHTAISMKITLTNLQTACRSLNSAWREVYVDEENGMSTEISALIIKKECEILQNGIILPTSEGRVYVHGTVQAIITDHPQHCKFMQYKQNACLWCRATGLDMLFGIKRRLKDSTDTGLFRLTDKHDFVPRQIIMSDHLHMIQLIKLIMKLDTKKWSRESAEEWMRRRNGKGSKRSGASVFIQWYLDGVKVVKKKKKSVLAVKMGIINLPFEERKLNKWIFEVATVDDTPEAMTEVLEAIKVEMERLHSFLVVLGFESTQLYSNIHKCTTV